MRLLPLILAALLLVGCKVKPVADAAQVKPLIGIASAVSRADVRVATIAEVAKDFDKLTPADFASFVAQQAKEARKELSAAAAETDAARESAGVAQAQLKEANTRIVTATEYWGYRWGKRIDKALVWISISLAAAVVMRALSLVLVGHPIGKLFSFASTAIFGVLTCGVSLLQSGADNLYFRKLAPGATQ